jgi:DNA-binding GntR family transcriptional regulator
MSEPEAYAALHAAIVAGSLSPGERLIEEELAERLGHSRGAVRGAILRLDHEGLVVRERNRGARVRRFTLEEAVEILEARAALESLAAGYAAERRTLQESRELMGLVGDMERLQVAGELLAMSERNAVMHRRILEISRHAVALDTCARLHSQVVRFQFRTVLAPGRSRKSLAEHGEIVASIAARDRPAAERAMREHLTNVAATLADVAAPDRIAEAGLVSAKAT